MQEPNFMRVTDGTIDRLIRRMSPFCHEGRWIMPECKLAAGVVGWYITDMIRAAQGQRVSGNPPNVARRAEIQAVRHWAGFLGLASDIIERVFADLGIGMAVIEQPKLKPVKVRRPRAKSQHKAKYMAAYEFLRVPATASQIIDRFGNDGCLSYLKRLGMVKRFKCANNEKGKGVHRTVKYYVAIEAKEPKCSI